MRRLNIGYFIKEGFSSIFSHGLMSFAAVCMIVACLIIMGSFSLLAVNVDEMLSQLEEENEFLAFIDEDYTDDQIRALMEQVRQIDNVDPNSVTFVSREQAKRDYLRGHESEGLYVNMPDEVLRDRLGKPYVRVLGNAKERAEELGITEFHVSITNTREYAVAFVVAEKEDRRDL